MFYTAVVCVEATAVLEVSGHVGGEVTIHCSGIWTTDNSSENYNVYFCKGDCSRENNLVQTERTRSAVTRRGRYSMEVSRGDGAFNVTIKRLRREDAGRYHCGVGKTFNVLYQEVNLIVLDGELLVRCMKVAAGDATFWDNNEQSVFYSGLVILYETKLNLLTASYCKKSCKFCPQAKTNYIKMINV